MRSNFGKAVVPAKLAPTPDDVDVEVESAEGVVEGEEEPGVHFGPTSCVDTSEVDDGICGPAELG